MRPFDTRVTAVIASGMRTPFLLERFPEIDPDTLQDPLQVATVICSVSCLPAACVVPEITILPLQVNSWP